MTPEHPILFTPDSVRAILAGRKTVTRRVVKPQPQWSFLADPPPSDLDWDGRLAWVPHLTAGYPDEALAVRCPYGQPGDVLWVRETWRPVRLQGGTGLYSGTISEHIEYLATEGDQLKLKTVRAQSGLSYIGDPLPTNYHRIFRGAQEFGDGGRWRRSIHMPRWACRLLLKVEAVRVERLQEISEEDILAEGCSVDAVAKFTGRPWSSMPTLHDAMRVAWEHFNDKAGRRWQDDPWVWVVSFRKVGA